MAGLTAELKAQGVQFVRFVWCDNANVIRAKVVPVDFLKSAYARGVGISFAQQGVPVVRDAFVADSGLGPVGEARLMGDWSSIVKLPHAPGHCRVMGNMMVQGQPWAHCPRHFLRRMIQNAAAQGLQIQAAFENEFYLLRPTDDGLEPLDNSLFCSVHSLNRTSEVFTALVESLSQAGCHVVGFHPESGGGQMELSVQHAEPMTAADQQVLYREVVHAVAHQEGLVSTFLPKPRFDRAGSGCHIHLSLWKDGHNITDPKNEEHKEASHFMAGILKHLPALMGVTTPTRNSYARLGKHLWSGAFDCWGYDNREAALRLPQSPTGVSHFEIKTHDATANPYLALGSIIAAGLNGIEREMKLSDCVQVDPGLLDAKELKKQGIKALPDSLKKSLGNLQKCKVLKEAMGDELHLSYLSVKKEELKSVADLTPEEEVELLLQRY